MNGRIISTFLCTYKWEDYRLNENSHGLLRWYFPKRTSIAKISEQYLADVSLLINMRPRKTLDYLTPLEVLTGKRVSVMSRI